MKTGSGVGSEGFRFLKVNAASLLTSANPESKASHKGMMTELVSWATIQSAQAARTFTLTSWSARALDSAVEAAFCATGPTFPNPIAADWRMLQSLSLRHSTRAGMQFVPNLFAEFTTTPMKK